MTPMRDPKFKKFSRETASAFNQTHHVIWETLHRDMLRLRTLFVMEPLIEAINMMLPLFPKRAICLPAACAVYSTPLVLTPIT